MEHAQLSVSLGDREVTEGISMCPAGTRMRRGTTPGATCGFQREGRAQAQTREDADVSDTDTSQHGGRPVGVKRGTSPLSLRPWAAVWAWLGWVLPDKVGTGAAVTSEPPPPAASLRPAGRWVPAPSDRSVLPRPRASSSQLRGRVCPRHCHTLMGHNHTPGVTSAAFP